MFLQLSCFFQYYKRDLREDVSSIDQVLLKHSNCDNKFGTNMFRVLFPTTDRHYLPVEGILLHFIN